MLASLLVEELASCYLQPHYIELLASRYSLCAAIMLQYITLQVDMVERYLDSIPFYSFSFAQAQRARFGDGQMVDVDATNLNRILQLTNTMQFELRACCVDPQLML